jgi:hypothetical protein
MPCISQSASDYPRPLSPAIIPPMLPDIPAGIVPQIGYKRQSRGNFPGLSAGLSFQLSPWCTMQTTKPGEFPRLVSFPYLGGIIPPWQSRTIPPPFRTGSNLGKYRPYPPPHNLVYILNRLDASGHGTRNPQFSKRGTIAETIWQYHMSAWLNLSHPWDARRGNRCGHDGRDRMQI